LEIFSDSASQVSAHIVVGEDGSIHETVPCLGILDPNRTACRAWHAGVSRYTKSDGETTIEGFNDCSLGIELVNYNGNAFEFTDAQYSALKDIFQILFKRFPDIQNPESVLGHEDIAGFRGKVDPGHRFDWNRFYSENYPGKSAPIRKPVLEQSLLQPLQALCRHAPSDSKDRDAFYAAVSSFCETASATNKRP
jgi:N-acetyl-anhydromuramyl-L-alanine amidase AmpD